MVPKVILQVFVANQRLTRRRSCRLGVEFLFFLAPATLDEVVPLEHGLYHEVVFLIAFVQEGFLEDG